MMLTVAVTIAAYNGEAYICEALDSVARQTRRPDQIIVVDDGSTDSTALRVRDWVAANRVGVELLQQENRGLPGARNRAIRHATTDLVALLDADDVFLPHHLGLVVQGFDKREDVILCFGDGESFDSDGILTPRLLAGTQMEALEYEAYDDGLRVLSGAVYSSLLRGNYIPVGATIFRRTASERVGLYDERFRLADDREFYLRLSRIGRFAYYPSVVYRKRVHGENLTHVKNRMLYRRSQLLVLEKMLAMADDLGLSDGEVSETRKAIGEQVWTMLYHASERGLASYGEMCRFLWGRRIHGPLMLPEALAARDRLLDDDGEAVSLVTRNLIGVGGAIGRGAEERTPNGPPGPRLLQNLCRQESTGAREGGSGA